MVKRKDYDLMFMRTLKKVLKSTFIGRKYKVVEHKEIQVSVIMPVYNVEKYLDEALQSITKQTLSNIEIIIVEDCSNDNTRMIVEEYSGMDERIIPIYNKKNEGLINSLNKAILIAKGKYIARMDGDDISDINRFAEQVRYLENNDIDLVGSQCYYFYSEKTDGKEMKYPTSDDGCREFLKYSSALAHPTWLGKRELFLKLQYRNIETCEDYDFLIRASMEGYKIGNVPLHLFYYRINREGISSLNASKQYLTAEYLAKKYRRHEVVEMIKYEEWIHSSKFIQLSNKVMKQFNYINTREIKLMKILSPLWIRQQIVRVGKKLY